MDDIRDTRPWFWILFFAVFAIAVVGLVIAISAKNSSVDEKKVVKEATAEVEEEFAGLHGAVAAANHFQETSNKLARRDRIRIKREVAAAVGGGEEQIHKMNSRVTKLESKQGELARENEKLKAQTAEATKAARAVEEELEVLNRQISRLSNNGGT